MKLSSLIGHTAELYSEIVQTQKPADRLMDFFFRSRKYLGSKDRRFISENVYGMLRNRKRLEWIAGILQRSTEARLLCILHLIRSEAVTPEVMSAEMNISHGEYAEIEHASAAEPYGTSSTETIALTYSFQEWMVKEWEKQYGQAEVIPLCSALNTQAPMTIRVNTINADREACKKALEEEGIETDKTEFSPHGLHLKRRVNLFQLNAFKQGLFEVQDEGSQLLTLLVDPKPGSKVVDACAGAGGKALALAALMKNRGEIFALDVHSGRVEEMQKRIRRSGVDSIRTMVVREDESVEALLERADYVLVDAPCSGTGTIRRNPGMKWSVSESMIEELRRKQRSILLHNARYVKSGGRLIYATCSLMPQENEEIVERFLSEQSGFKLLSPSALLARYHLAHLADNKYFQLLPQRSSMDGFFAAVMERTVPTS